MVGYDLNVGEVSSFSVRHRTTTRCASKYIVNVHDAALCNVVSLQVTARFHTGGTPVVDFVLVLTSPPQLVTIDGNVRDALLAVVWLIDFTSRKYPRLCLPQMHRTATHLYTVNIAVFSHRGRGYWVHALRCDAAPT